MLLINIIIMIIVLVLLHINHNNTNNNNNDNINNDNDKYSNTYNTNNNTFANFAHGGEYPHGSRRVKLLPGQHQCLEPYSFYDEDRCGSRPLCYLVLSVVYGLLVCHVSYASVMYGLLV